jgi:hypothetical protein
LLNVTNYYIVLHMEEDGVTRVFLLEDQGFSEVTYEAYPKKGEQLSQAEDKATVDRADIIYTIGGIVWGERPPTLIIKDRVDTDPKELKVLAAAAEMTLRKSGLTILVDRLSPEDMRYTGEDHDFGDGSSL